MRYIIDFIVYLLQCPGSAGKRMAGAISSVRCHHVWNHQQKGASGSRHLQLRNGLFGPRGWTHTSIKHLWPQVIWRGHSTIYFSYIHQNVYSEVPSKKRRKAIASKITISYQNKDFKKSNVYEVIISQIRLQRLKFNIGALVYVLANRILG